VYHKVEIGYPSDVVPELMEYAENPADPTGTIYGYVPIQIVEDIAFTHGGIKEECVYAIKMFLDMKSEWITLREFTAPSKEAATKYLNYFKKGGPGCRFKLEEVKQK